MSEGAVSPPVIVTTAQLRALRREAVEAGHVIGAWKYVGGAPHRAVKCQRCDAWITISVRDYGVIIECDRVCRA